MTDDRPTTDQNRNLRYRSETVPPELVALGGWVATGDDKIPHHPGTLRRADPSNPASGGTFAQAIAAAAQPGLGRIGLILDPVSFLVAFDWDGCVDPGTGTINPAVLADLAELDTYAEYSPSRTGVRAFAFGVLPPGARRRGKVEAYVDGRYVSVTGWSLEGYDAIGERTEQIASWHRRRLAGPAKPAKPAPSPPPIAPLHLDDEAILLRARRFAKFGPLFDAGDLGDAGGDHSAGDLTLCNLLVRAGAVGAGQVDRLHRASALTRPKWDERRGAVTYGERTVARAMDGTVAAHGGPARTVPSPAPLTPRPVVMMTTPPSADPIDDDASCADVRVAALIAENTDLRERLAAAEAKRDELQATLDRREEQRHLDQRVREAKHVQPEKDLIVGLGWTYEAAAATEPTFKRPDGKVGIRRTPDGFVRITRRDLAAQTGKSTRTITNQIATAERLGVAEFRRERDRVIDPETGETQTIPDSTVLYFRPAGGDVRTMHHRALAVTEDERKVATGKNSGWGGKREPACLDHPEAGTITRIEVVCAADGCERVLDRREERADARPHDAANRGGVDILSTKRTLPSPRGRPSPLVKMSTPPAEPDWMVDAPAPAESFGAAWLSGMPGPSTAADRYTDVKEGW